MIATNYTINSLTIAHLVRNIFVNLDTNFNI